MALPGVDPYIEGKRSELLKAIATAGSQGEAAYKDAQNQITSYRQQAIDNAAKGFSGSAELAAQLQAQSGTPFDRRLSDSAAAQADNTAALQRMQAANESYLTNVSAAQGALQAQNQNRLADRETQLKALQAQLDAKAKQEEDDRNFERQMKLADMSMKQQAATQKVQSDAAKAAEKARPTAPKILSLAENIASLYGEGTDRNTPGRNWVTDNIEMTAQDLSAFNRTTPEFEMAKLLAEGYGLSPEETAQILSPSSVAKSQNTAQKALNPTPQADSAAKALAQKYDTKGVTYDLAQSVLNNVDFRDDVQWIMSGADGKTRDEVDKILKQYYVTDRGWNAEYNVLKGEYLGMLPTKKK